MYGIDQEIVRKAKTWKEYDNEFTTKMFGDPETYYNKVSCEPKILGITVPTLVVHSVDDPIVKFDVLPIEKCTANKHIIVGVVKKGGHVCYFQGWKGHKRWYP